MNRSIDVLTQVYKPYRITRINKCILFNTMDGDYVVKTEPKINYLDLYNYLYTRGFKYLPKLVDSSRDNTIVFEYQSDASIDNNQKGLDLIKLVALLHSKTSYFKEITKDKYKEIYENLKNNVQFIDNYYGEMFDRFISEEYYMPSHYLFLRNYSLIYNACKYCLAKIDEWYNKVSDKTKERVVLVHNNLRLDHYIKNENDYLISWDNYTIDSPIVDLYKFYQNEWYNLSFSDLFKEYNDDFELLEEEKILLDILISIPTKVELSSDMLRDCREIRKLIGYLNKSSKLVLSS